MARITRSALSLLAGIVLAAAPLQTALAQTAPAAWPQKTVR